MGSVVELNFKYMADLSVEDLQRLKKDLEGIKAFLPEHLMGPFWSWCNQIRGNKEKQPCGCKSAAGHWSRCVEELRNYVSGKGE